MARDKTIGFHKLELASIRPSVCCLNDHLGSALEISIMVKPNLGNDVRQISHSRTPNNRFTVGVFAGWPHRWQKTWRAWLKTRFREPQRQATRSTNGASRA